MIKNRCLLLACCFVFCSGTTIGQQIEQKAHVLENASQAVERALAFTGFKISKDYSLHHMAEEMARLDTLEQSIFPFLADQINGSVVWRIEFDSVLLKYEGKHQGEGKEYYRSFVVTTDAVTGRLLEIVSTFGVETDSLTEGKSAELAEKQLSGEVFTGFPSELPVVNFKDMLCQPDIGVVGIPADVHVIVGRYVLWSKPGVPRWEQPTPVWVVEMLELSTDRKSLISRWRWVVDANNGKGKFLKSTSIAPSDATELE